MVKAFGTDAWAEQKIVREIMVFLHSHGVGTARRFASSRPTARTPCRSHEHVILAGECEALLDAHAVDVYECLPRYVVSKLGDIPAGEAAIETLLKHLLQTRHRDDWVFRTLVADDAADFSFDWWQHYHVPIVS